MRDPATTPQRFPRRPSPAPKGVAILGMISLPRESSSFRPRRMDSAQLNPLFLRKKSMLSALNFPDIFPSPLRAGAWHSRPGAWYSIVDSGYT